MGWNWNPCPLKCIKNLQKIGMSYQPLTAGWDRLLMHAYILVYSFLKGRTEAKCFRIFWWPWTSNLSSLGPRILIAIPYWSRLCFFCASTSSLQQRPHILAGRLFLLILEFGTLVSPRGANDKCVTLKTKRFLKYQNVWGWNRENKIIVPQLTDMFIFLAEVIQCFFLVPWTRWFLKFWQIRKWTNNFVDVCFHFLDSTSTKPQPPKPPISQWFHWLFAWTGRFLPVAQASQGIDLQGRLDRVGCVGQMHLLDCHALGIPANQRELKYIELRIECWAFMISWL